MTYRTLGFPEYGITNASNFKYSFPMTATQKGVNTKMANKIDIALCKSAKPKKQCKIYLRVLRVRNNICKHFKCGFTHFVAVIRV